MEYHGKLYGKKGRYQIPLTMTTDDVHAIEAENVRLKESLGHIHSILNERDAKGEDLQLGSTAFKSCLRWSKQNDQAQAPKEAK